ncbi:hypothetical protein BDR04DRAFT_1054125 [Suillus decipiens]|nr:hypothetical protein BDR04DRAFT_1054125 [Suillus decipiens]
MPGWKRSSNRLFIGAHSVLLCAIHLVYGINLNERPSVQYWLPPVSLQSSTYHTFDFNLYPVMCRCSSPRTISFASSIQDGIFCQWKLTWIRRE